MPLELLNRYENQEILTTQTLVDVTIPTVVMANTIVEISMRSATNDGVSNTSFYCTIELTSNTNIRIQRGNNSRSTTVEWVVYEFDSSVTVNRDTFVQNSTTINTVVPSVDLSKSISIAGYRTSTTMASNDNIHRCSVRHRLTTSTQLTTDLQSSDTGSTVVWQVIEFSEDIAVTLHAASSVSWPVNIGISAVDLAKTWLKFSWNSNQTGLRGEDLISCRYTSTTNIRLEDFFAGAVDKAYAIYVIEYTGAGALNVERGYDSITGQTSISPVVAATKARAMLLPGHEYNSMIESDFSGNNNFQYYGTSAKIDSDIAITFQRFTSAQQGTVAWELVTFPDAVTPSGTIKWNYYRMMRG